MEILRTEHLILREFTPGDADAYFQNVQDPQVLRYDPYRACADREAAAEAVRQMSENYQNPEIPYYPYNLAVVHTDSGRLIGFAGIGGMDLSETEFSHEIDYWLIEEFRGFHYGAEMLLAFVPWCMSRFGLRRVFACVRTDNARSGKTLANVGFVPYNGAFPKRKPDRQIFIYQG